MTRVTVGFREMNRCQAPRRILVAVTRGGYLRHGAATLFRFSELNETPSLCSSQGPPGKDGLPGHPGQRGETVSILGARPSLPSAARRPREDVGMGPVWGDRAGQPHVTSHVEGRCWFQGRTQNLHDTHDATGTFFLRNNPETPAPRRLTLAAAGDRWQVASGCDTPGEGHGPGTSPGCVRPGPSGHGVGDGGLEGSFPGLCYSEDRWLSGWTPGTSRAPEQRLGH